MIITTILCTCQIYFFSDLDNFIYFLGILSTGNFFPPVPKLEKLKMSQQPVSNEFPLILPVPIVMMFSLLCFNKVCQGEHICKQSEFPPSTT